MLFMSQNENEPEAGTGYRAWTSMPEMPELRKNPILTQMLVALIRINARTYFPYIFVKYRTRYIPQIPKF